MPKFYRRIGLFSLAVLAVSLGVIYWYYSVQQNTTRSFWAMVDNNLATSSVVKKTTQQNQTVTINSYNQLVFNGRPALHALRQVTDSSTEPSSQLMLETIGTEKADYQRYSSITRPTPSGQAIDYSEVYKIWLQTSSKEKPASQLGGNLFGPVMFGQLNHAQRAEMMTVLREAYLPIYTGLENQDARRVFRYSVKVNMRSYTKAIARYIKLSGIKGSSVSPESYAKDATTDVTMRVDALSGQLVSIVNNSGGGIKEEYSSYGIRKEVLPPAKISTVEDLQKAIQAASQ